MNQCGRTLTVVANSAVSGVTRTSVTAVGVGTRSVQTAVGYVVASTIIHVCTFITATISSSIIIIILIILIIFIIIIIIIIIIILIVVSSNKTNIVPEVGSTSTQWIGTVLFTLLH